MFRPLAGAVIATAGTTPRVTVTASPLLPKAFVQATAIEFAPSASENGLVVALEVLDPPTVQVVPPGIVPAPLTVKVTFVEEEVVLAPSSGAVIATTGVFPRLTVIEPGVVPKAFVQATLMLFAPIASATPFVPVLDDAEPLTVQLVPAGIDEPPSTVYVTFTDVAVVFRPLAGAVIASAGTTPRVTATAELPLPKAFTHATVIEFVPSASATLFVVVLVDAEPLTVQVVPAGIDEPPSTA